MNADEMSRKLEAARNLALEGNFEGALALLDEIDQAGQTSAPAMFTRAVCLYHLGHTTEAMTIFHILVVRFNHRGAKKYLAELRRGSQPERKIQDSGPSRGLWELILDPRSIQWLLMLGGGLLVVGLIVWLGSLSLFQEPGVLAVAMGAATAAVLGAGWFVVLRTRFHVAGRALTFLACLVAPLNLWFYDAWDLVALEGNLWMGGVVCCLAFGATAYLLRDPLFVYVVEAGITLTALLLLATRGLAIQMPYLSLLLVSLGIVSLHAERAFPPTESPFSRRRFGMALFWSGQAQLGVGLAVLLAAQAIDWLKIPAESLLGREWDAVGLDGFRVWVGLLWLAGAYAYSYSDIVVRRIGLYLYLAAFCLLWAIAILIGSMLREEGVILVLASIALAANLSQRFIAGDNVRLNKMTASLGVVLSVQPLLMGVVLHLRATSLLVPEEWARETGWLFVIAMISVAAGCRISAFVQTRAAPQLSAAYFFFTIAALMVAAVGLLRMIGLIRWSEQAPLLILIPIGCMVASRLWRGRPPELPLAGVAHTATALILLTVPAATLTISNSFVRPVTALTANLQLALVFAEGAVFYVLAAAVRKRGGNVYLAVASGCVALWQLLGFWDVPHAYAIVIYAVAGVTLLLVYRFLPMEKFQANPFAVPFFQSGNALLTVAFIAAALQALARLAGGRVEISATLPALVITLFVSVLAAIVERHSGWRRWYVTTSVALAGLTFLTLNLLIDLSHWERVEIYCVAAGVACLVGGHVGQSRQSADEFDLSSFGLWLGSMLTVGPLAVAVIFHRFWGLGLSLIDEFGLLTASVLLLASGIVLKIKSTTIAGGGSLAIHVGVLIVSVGYTAQLAVGVYLATGGALLFALGVVLSVYRERLAALPARISHREGVFKFMDWR